MLQGVESSRKYIINVLVGPDSITDNSLAACRRLELDISKDGIESVSLKKYWYMQLISKDK